MAAIIFSALSYKNPGIIARLVYFVQNKGPVSLILHWNFHDHVPEDIS